MEHIEPDGLKAFLETVHSILAPGGYFIATVPSTRKPISRKHYQHFTRESLIGVLESSFEVLEISGFERNNIATKIIRKLRLNGLARVDIPLLNGIIVRQFQRQYKDTRQCGRLLAIA